MLTKTTIPDLLSTHGAVLAALAGNQDIRMREIAARVGVTERHIWKSIADLTAAGCVVVRKEGRRNLYEVTLPRELLLALQQLVDEVGRA